MASNTVPVEEGEETPPILDDPYAKVEVGAFDPVAGMVKPDKPTGPGTGSREWTRYMVARREGLKKVDFDRHREGPKRTRITRREAEEAALERMVPKALKVLQEQLTSPDDRVKQSAAVKVLEYARGKPVQQVRAEVAGVQRIVYESAAYNPDVGEAIETPMILELTAGEEDEAEGLTEAES